jgi:hypothetical protein
MNETQSETMREPVEHARPVGIARRRLLRAGLAATPVILAVSGRSAMAASCQQGGLSPLAWNSLAPDGTNCVAVSHTVTSNALGRSPGFWTPNANGHAQTFQAPKWPVPPFDKVETIVGTREVLETDGVGPSRHTVLKTEVDREVKAWNSYDFLAFKGVSADDPGFDNGAKFSSVFGGGDSRSFSRILLEETGRHNVKWHFCAAYLNVMSMGGEYAITLSELQYLYTNKKLTPGGVTLTDGQIKAFLDQTWS